MGEKFYITTAIDYVNAPPHLGHALEKVQADVIARYQRLLKKEVYFLTGTDEHGIKIVQAAEAMNKETKEFVDESVEKFKKLIEDLNISNDGFIRTSDKEKHWPNAQEFWKKIAEKGDIYKDKYKGYYCVGCEAYVTEKDLVDGKCPYHQSKNPELIEEENYFFKLSEYVGAVREKIGNDELEILSKSRKNEVLEMLKDVKDISCSRPSKKVKGWGVPVPGDDSQTMYVWVEALTNYLYPKKYWPADLHMIGKDILRFHAVIWPAMLLSAGLELPKKIFVHGFVLSDGKRMSKTDGNVIDPFELIKEYGTDALRYYLLREITPFEDGEVTKEKFKEAYNANLANGLGNLVSRVMKMAQDNLEKPVVGDTTGYKFGGYLAEKMNEFRIDLAMDYVWNKISELDNEIQEKKPWESKDKKVIENLVLNLYRIGRMLEPFMPETSKKILEIIKNNKMPEPLFPRKD
ncbi:methionine--tRNA ligase [Patescibacteria group bacterium]|nr:methionine--tRNA ligase [Patescibacteria group bacterium]